MQKLKPLLNWLKSNYFLAGVVILVVIYLVTRLINLTILPVFADEAIYIYWSQLAMSEWDRYLFYPLNDGKTPLFIWLMMPALKLLTDPLVAGRLVSVLFGLGQLLITIKITSLLTKNKWLQLLSGLLVILMPGFMLNNRLALMDTAATFFLSVSFFFAYTCLSRLTEQSKIFPYQRPAIVRGVLSGLFFGLALLVKFSNILFLPVLFSLIFYFWPANLISKKLWRSKLLELLLRTIPLIAIALLAVVILFTLKISPAFSQLFARGSDFLHPVADFFAHPWQIIGANFNQFWHILSNYLTSVLFLFAIVLAIFVVNKDKRQLLILVSGLLFLLPILLLGKIIYPRYLLPVLPFFIVSFCLSLSHLFARQFLWFKVMLLTLIFLIGGYFAATSLFEPEQMQLLPKDREQFLVEWSAGYGILPAVNYIEEISKEKRTLVLTEGHIGTLPDGLQIYFYNRPSRNNIRIEGIGQPVRNFDEVLDLIAEYEQVILVVNSHRLELNEPLTTMLQEYQRPLPGSPSLQIWQVK